MNLYTGKDTPTLASVRLIAAPLFALFLAACGGSGGGDGGDESGTPGIPVTTTDYLVEIDAGQVIQGAPAPETASATANLRTSVGDDIFASGTVTITGVTATLVTINAGSAGETGPIAATLQLSGSGSWTVPANTTLDIAATSRIGFANTGADRIRYSRCRNAGTVLA